MESVINMNRMMRKAQDDGPDWEQRRYEIAKETAAAMFGAITEGAIRKNGMLDPNYAMIAEVSVKMADAVVEQLKKTKEAKDGEASV